MIVFIISCQFGDAAGNLTSKTHAEWHTLATMMDVVLFGVQGQKAIFIQNNMEYITFVSLFAYHFPLTF